MIDPKANEKTMQTPKGIARQRKPVRVHETSNINNTQLVAHQIGLLR
jgi:hypothetical protein